MEASPLTGENGNHLFLLMGCDKPCGSSGCILWGSARTTAMGKEETLHSSFSPHAATWVVNGFNVPAQAFRHKIRSLTARPYRGSYKALINRVELSKCRV